MNALKRYLSRKAGEQVNSQAWNMRETIQRDIAPALEAKRKQDDLLERCTRTHNGIKTQSN